MSSARKIGLLLDSVSDNMGDKAIGLVLRRMFEKDHIPFEIVDPFRPDLSSIAMLVIGGGELIRTPGDPFYDAFRARGPHVLNSVGVLDGTKTEYLDEYPIVTVRTEADRIRLGRGEVVPCLSLLYSDFYQRRDDFFGVPEGAIGVHLTANFRDDPLQLAKILRQADSPVVFLPINHYQADEKIQAALSTTIPGSRVLPKPTPDQAFAVIGRLRLLITCSLHATLLAYACGTRFLTYGAMPKIEAFLRERGLDRHAFASAAEIGSLLLEPGRAPHRSEAMFERDRERCRMLADRIMLAADAALKAPPSKSVFTIKASNPVRYQRDMTAAFAAGMDAANSLRFRIELERRDVELRTFDGEPWSLQDKIIYLLRRELLAWRVTAPFRLISSTLRKLGIDPRKILPLPSRLRADQPETEEPMLGPHVTGRSPEQMPLIELSPVNTDLRLIALHQLDNDAAEHSRIDFWRQRAELAKRFGIYGFCFPYRRSLGNSFGQAPWVSEDDPATAMRFCISLGRESLMEWPAETGEGTSGVHVAEYVDTLLREMLPVLQHPQYIRVHNKPLLLIADSFETDEIQFTVRQLREFCRHSAYQEPFVVITKTSGGDAIEKAYGADGMLELSDLEDRHGEEQPGCHRQSTFLRREQMRDYRRLIERSYETIQPPYRIFQSILVNLNAGGEDARELGFQHASPAGYQEWLENACIRTERLFDGDERLVFIQGWNAGRPAERFGWDSRYCYGYLNATAKALKSIAARKDPLPMKAAVIVHVYYPELWPEIANFLKLWESAFGLYITIPVHADASFIDAVRAEWPQAVLWTVENRGRDMAPFLAIAAQAIDDGHSLICKVHTKKSPHLRGGAEWRRDMLTKLLGNFSLEQIRYSFQQNAALGIVGPEGYILSGSYYLRLNRRHLSALLKKFGYEDDPMPFVFSAGSMFWIRADAMKPLLDLKLRTIDFEAERGQPDGTLAHALERAFPLAGRLQGYRIADTRVIGRAWGQSSLRSDFELAVYNGASSIGAYW